MQKMQKQLKLLSPVQRALPVWWGNQTSVL